MKTVGCLLFLCGALSAAASSLLWPAPGTVFIEQVRPLTGNEWRVTDPHAGEHFDAAKEFLPNPRFVVAAPADLDPAKLTAASLLVDFWNGHPGTIDKQIRFNDGPWQPLAHPAVGAVAGEEINIMSQTQVEIPLAPATVRAGDNLLEGTCGPNHFKWGQWGWSAVALRLQLDPVHTSPHPATLRLPGAGSLLPEDPVLELAVPAGAPAVTEVRFFARYAGVDENGDGVFDDWHGFFRGSGWEGHLGTVTAPPWRVRWDTSWLPDQKPGAIALVAHVRDARGVWTVTPLREGLTLDRTNRRVTLHRPFRVTPFFWVRDNRVRSAILPLPLDFNPATVTAASLHLRAWNLRNNEQEYTPLRVNTGPWLTTITGKDHGFSQHFFPLDPAALQAGDNLLTFTSTTKHHGAELLWPGPVLLLQHNPTAR